MVAGSVEVSAARLRPRIAVQTDIGLVRARNEDAAYVDADGWYVVLADGMGGVGAGEVASAVAVATVSAVLDRARPQLSVLACAPPAERRGAVRELLDRAVRRANHAVRDRGEREPDKRGMGTTLEIVVVVGSDAFVAHVGDSRTYLVDSSSRALQLTTDHTVAEQMWRNGAMTLADAAVSPLRAVLVHAVGVAEDVEVELSQTELRPGDRLFACSDGLHDHFAAHEIAHWVKRDPLEQTLASMVELARTRGGDDNITGIIVEPVVPATAPAAIRSWEETKPRMPSAMRRRASRAPLERPPNPLMGMSDDAVCAFVEEVLRDEDGGPHAVPRTSLTR